MARDFMHEFFMRIFHFCRVELALLAINGSQKAL